MKPSQELTCAVRAARTCKKFLLENFIKALSYKKKGSQEIVTKVDFKCENIIKNFLNKSFPNYGFIGEETQPNKLKNKTFWAVDPIDGTTNFVHGLPLFVVTISLVKNNQLVLGVIFDPVHNEMFTAEKGKGSYLNGQRVHVSETKNLINAVIQFDAGYNNRSSLGPIIAKVGDKIRDIHMGRSAALQMADVCCGRSDAYLKIKTGLWDVLAGKLLIDEAGGKITNFEGKPHDTFKDKNIAASNGKIHDSLLKQIKA